MSSVLLLTPSIVYASTLSRTILLHTPGWWCHGRRWPSLMKCSMKLSMLFHAQRLRDCLVEETCTDLVTAFLDSVFARTGFLEKTVEVLFGVLALICVPFCTPLSLSLRTGGMTQNPLGIQETQPLRLVEAGRQNQSPL